MVGNSKILWLVSHNFFDNGILWPIGKLLVVDLVFHPVI